MQCLQEQGTLLTTQSSLQPWGILQSVWISDSSRQQQMINNKQPNSDYTIHFSLPGKASPGQTLGLDSDLVLVSVFVFCVQDSSLSTHNLNCLTASEDWNFSLWRTAGALSSTLVPPCGERSYSSGLKEPLSPWTRQDGWDAPPHLVFEHLREVSQGSFRVWSCRI